MKTLEDYEAIRRAYFIEQLSIRAIRRKLGYDRETIRKAITHAGPPGYQLKEPRPARVLGPYQVKIKELLDESEKQRRKQRYTAHCIYELLVAEGNCRLWDAETDSYAPVAELAALVAVGQGAYLGGCVLPNGRVVFTPYYSRHLVMWDPELGVAYGRDIALAAFWNHRS